MALSLSAQRLSSASNFIINQQSNPFHGIHHGHHKYNYLQQYGDDDSDSFQGFKSSFETTSDSSFNTNSLNTNSPLLNAQQGVLINFSETTKALLNATVNRTAESVVGEISEGGDGQSYDWSWYVLLVLKTTIMLTIILAAILGNLLVIVSVCRHHKLRITTNYFIVSLACADILVAVFAMSFNASVVITERWIFNEMLCDFWNSCDVLFSTASIMHLSCISYDRYYAIIKPLDYPMKITTKRVAIMIIFVWIASALISYIPIFTGIYTTQERLNEIERTSSLSNFTCVFEVNIPYAIVSSSVSFWLPCCIMLAAYWKIYQEATKQEKFIYRSQQMAQQTAAQTNHHHHDGKNQRNSSADTTATQVTTTGGGSGASNSNAIQVHAPPHRNSHGDDPESGSSTPTKRTISKMKREHKAAKTLGIIMGAFILCWLPFFIWYVTSTICGNTCDTPKVVVDILFWIGYFNSAMNPIIYAYFNREFREAFKVTLREIFYCCHFKCLEGPRDHFSCTYRSTQDIGLVENRYRD